MPKVVHGKFSFAAKVGLYGGLVIATFLSPIALVFYALPGESDADRLGLGIVWIIISYFGAAVIVGPCSVLFGRPLTTESPDHYWVPFWVSQRCLSSADSLRLGQQQRDRAR